MLGIALPFILEPAATARMADLETQGVKGTATVTNVEVSAVQAARHSTVGGYMAMRGLGASRKLAAGATLMARSSARSSAREARASAYYDIEYEFPWAGGQVATGTDRLMLSRATTLDVGSEITVLHDPLDPAVHRLVSYSKPTPHVPAVIKYGPAIVCALLGAFLLWWALQEPSDARETTVAAASSGRGLPPDRVTRVAAVAPARRAGFVSPSGSPKGFGPRARA